MASRQAQRDELVELVPKCIALMDSDIVVANRELDDFVKLHPEIAQSYNAYVKDLEQHGGSQKLEETIRQATEKANSDALLKAVRGKGAPKAPAPEVVDSANEKPKAEDDEDENAEYDDYDYADDEEESKKFHDEYVDDSGESTTEDLTRTYIALMMRCVRVLQLKKSLPAYIESLAEGITEGTVTIQQVKNEFGIDVDTRIFEHYSENNDDLGSDRIEAPSQLYGVDDQVTFRQACSRGDYGASVFFNQTLRKLETNWETPNTEEICYLLVHRLTKPSPPKTKPGEPPAEQPTEPVHRNNSWLVMSTIKDTDHVFRDSGAAQLQEGGAVTPKASRAPILSSLKTTETKVKRPTLPEWLLALAAVSATWNAPIECEMFLRILENQKVMSSLSKVTQDRYDMLWDRLREREKTIGPDTEIDFEELYLPEELGFMKKLNIPGLPTTHSYAKFSKQLGDDSFFTESVVTVVEVDSKKSVADICTATGIDPSKFMEVVIPENDALGWLLFNADSAAVVKKAVNAVTTKTNIAVQLLFPNIDEILKLLLTQAMYIFNTDREDSADYPDGTSANQYILDCKIGVLNPTPSIKPNDMGDFDIPALNESFWKFRESNIPIGVVLANSNTDLMFCLGMDECTYGLYLFAAAWVEFSQIMASSPNLVRTSTKDAMTLLYSTLRNGICFALGLKAAGNYDRGLFTSVFGRTPEHFITALGSMPVREQVGNWNGDAGRLPIPAQPLIKVLLVNPV
jgi:hypothetical protein